MSLGIAVKETVQVSDLCFALPLKRLEGDQNFNHGNRNRSARRYPFRMMYGRYPYVCVIIYVDY